MTHGRGGVRLTAVERENHTRLLPVRQNASCSGTAVPTRKYGQSKENRKIHTLCQDRRFVDFFNGRFLIYKVGIPNEQMRKRYLML